jgi:hypothetical protein
VFVKRLRSGNKEEEYGVEEKVTHGHVINFDAKMLWGERDIWSC